MDITVNITSHTFIFRKQKTGYKCSLSLHCMSPRAQVCLELKGFGDTRFEAKKNLLDQVEKFNLKFENNGEDSQ